ncbi:MAG TPA: hypothetical protein VL614_14795 [Acetobacteraceae bacterium]|nr:hypothetical protein [Acetobacteraceae bacterium]
MLNLKRLFGLDQLPPPVDRDQRVLTDGSPVTPAHRELRPDGQQQGYVVLTEAERAKGFVRPVRRSYLHVGLGATFLATSSGYAILVNPGRNGCGTRTTMSQSIAETYARCPEFYTGTFCCACGQHRPLDEFVWEGTQEQVGS